MGFEVFDKGSAPLPTVPSVTIQKRGLFSLNEAANEMIGRPEAIQFLWDADRRLIALRPVALTDPNAYPARLQGPAKERANGRARTVLIAGTMFARFIGLDTTVAKRWVPRKQDGMLVLDLNEPGQVVVANRNRGKASGDAEAHE